MQLNPYLLCSDQCEAAFKFYEQCLGTKIEAMMTHAGTPAEEHVPAEGAMFRSGTYSGRAQMLGPDDAIRLEPSVGFVF
jgi:uncharacterized glyoxalase superfamily protein PhnB